MIELLFTETLLALRQERARRVHAENELRAARQLIAALASHGPITVSQEAVEGVPAHFRLVTDHDASRRQMRIWVETEAAKVKP